MLEQVIDVDTPDGRMNTWLYAPDEGRHPLVVLYMGSSGVCEELAEKCRRLASAGFCVAMPNLYYRWERFVDIDPDRLKDPAYGRQAALMWKLNSSLTNSMAVADTEALIAAVGRLPFASTSAVGALGYCMGGRLALRAAGALNERMVAAASMHGARFITEAADSAHLLIPQIRAELYFGCAQNDEYVRADEISRLEECLRAAAAPFRIEVHPGTEHGFTNSRMRQFQRAANERAWVRLHALFRRRLLTSVQAPEQ